MTYPKWKYSGLGPLDRCIVQSEAEEAALEGVWADTPAVFDPSIPTDNVPVGGKFTVAGIYDVAPLAAMPKETAQAEPEKAHEAEKAVAPGRFCGTCGKPGHNARTCPQDNPKLRK